MAGGEHVKGLVGATGRALLFLVACWLAVPVLPARAAPADPGPERRELVVVVPEDVVSTDPARVARHGVTEAVQRLLYRRLLEKDGAGYRFDLARSIEMVDATTWRVAIAPGQVTAEGRAITAAEIARHFQRLLSDPAMGGQPTAARERLPYVAGVAAQGDSVVFRLSRPWAGLLAALAREPVALVGPSGQAVPTGPFRLERWDRGNRIILRRVEPAGPGEPTHIRFEVVPAAEERLRRVLSGQAHIAVSLPADAPARLAASSRARAVAVPQSRVHFVEFDVTRPPFDDARVRRALNMAVDLDSLVRSVLQGRAVPVATLLSPVTLGYDGGVPAIGYDPVQARRLLAESGYPEGFEFELDATAAKRREAEAIREMLARVGINAVVRIWPDWATLRRQIVLGNRQAWLGEWGNSSMDPAGAIWPKLHSEGEANYGGYRDPVLDAMLEEAETRLGPEERFAAYGVLQRYLRQEAPMLFGYTVYDVYGVAAGVQWDPAGGFLDVSSARWLEESGG